MILTTFFYLKMTWYNLFKIWQLLIAETSDVISYMIYLPIAESQPSAWSTPELNASSNNRYQHPNSVDTPCLPTGQNDSPTTLPPQPVYKQEEGESSSPCSLGAGKTGHEWRPCSAGGGTALVLSAPMSTPQHPLSAPPFSSASSTTAVSSASGGYQSPVPTATITPRKSSDPQVKSDFGKLSCILIWYSAIKRKHIFEFESPLTQLIWYCKIRLVVDGR